MSEFLQERFEFVREGMSGRQLDLVGAALLRVRQLARFDALTVQCGQPIERAQQTAWTPSKHCRGRSGSMTRSDRLARIASRALAGYRSEESTARPRHCNRTYGGRWVRTGACPGRSSSVPGAHRYADCARYARRGGEHPASALGERRAVRTHWGPSATNARPPSRSTRSSAGSFTGSASGLRLSSARSTSSASLKLERDQSLQDVEIDIEPAVVHGADLRQHSGEQIFGQRRQWFREVLGKRFEQDEPGAGRSCRQPRADGPRLQDE